MDGRGAAGLHGLAPSAAARAWIARQVPVFPCQRGTKRPLVPHGLKDASLDSVRIEEWWRRWPDALIGMPTGELTGVFALDVDRRDEKDGFATLAALEAAHGRLPETWAQRTPRGGEHRLFAWPGMKVKNSTSAIGIGLDVRGDGGYIVLAPSLDTHGRYECIDDRPPAPAPDWLVTLVNLPKQRGAGEAFRAAVLPAAGHGPYAAAALQSECDAVAHAAAGERNHTLNRAAFSLGQLVGAGALDRADVEAALTSAATAVGLIRDDGADAIRRTIRSGLDAGVRRPRDVPSWDRKSPSMSARADAALSPKWPENTHLANFSPTEDGIALAFAARHEADLRYCHDAGCWYTWTGQYWRQERTKRAFTWARDLCREMNRQDNVRLARASTAAAVERFAQADERLAVTAAIWDRDPWLLGTPGGVVDLRTGCLAAARREDFITKLTSVSPAPHGSGHPLWSRFLDEATRGDAGLRRFLRQIAGYCLTGETREHALFFVYGPGGNGKSVFLNAVSMVLG